ncbi:MAG: ribonuclease J [Rickettsiales bacterium]|nr:ribonuclease J [Rickettsiales bacterium]
MSNKKLNKEDLVFLPLGGSNEIGMNVNLYHYNGKWIIIDLGAGFAGDDFPGADMLAPDLSFVYENKKDFLGIVLTHGHEDHLGAVGWLYEKLQLPIYATPFTAQIVENKLEQVGMKGKAKVKIINPGSRFNLGDFDLELIQITHSIPEMNGIMLRTPVGNIFHTGDWKFDPNPVVRPTTDFNKLEAIGKEGVLAMVCDSTNVFNDRFSGSEGDLEESLTKLIGEQRGTVYVSTFASNVARIETICKAAMANKRKVALAGLSLHKITKFAKNTGYLKDIEPFINDTDVKNLPRDRVLVICTGCQGEPNAALTKLANGENQYLKITAKDTVIFSSKIIPGNEKKIFAIMNKFVRLKCEVFTEKDRRVHVSGHPSSEELTRMYELVKPQIAIPVHGEPVHIHEHIKLAKRIGVPKNVEIQNGEMVRISGENPESLKHIKFGYLGVDGYMLQPKDGAVMAVRRKLRENGIIIVSFTLNQKGKLVSDIIVKSPGSVDENENQEFITYLIDGVAEIVETNAKTDEDKLIKKIRRHVKDVFDKELNKNPIVEICINRLD